MNQADQVDSPARLEVDVMGMQDTCRDHRCLTACQKQHRQNEPAGSGRHSYEGGGLCDRGSRTHVGTTDISPPVKNNTDRMNQLVRIDVPTRSGGRCDIWDMCRAHRYLTICQKQHRQNEKLVRDIPTRVDVPVTGDRGHV